MHNGCVPLSCTDPSSAPNDIVASGHEYIYIYIYIYTSDDVERHRAVTSLKRTAGGHTHVTLYDVLPAAADIATHMRGLRNETRDS